METDTILNTDILVEDDGFSIVSEVTTGIAGDNNDFWQQNEEAETPSFNFLTKPVVVVGRDEELELLGECLQRTCSGPSELVLLHGQSGVGKSAIVESLRAYMGDEGDSGGEEADVLVGEEFRGEESGNQDLSIVSQEAVTNDRPFLLVSAKFEPPKNDENAQNEEDKPFYLVGGKFDQYLKREPFSAITAAFGELIDLLSQTDAVTKETIAAALTTELTPEELQLLSCFVSNLHHLVVIPSTTTSPSSEATHDVQLTTPRRQYRAFDGFTMLCQKFLGVLSRFACSVCIFLDDLQWADRESLAVIAAFARDKASTHILLVAAYRDPDDTNTTDTATTATDDGEGDEHHEIVSEHLTKFLATEFAFPKLDLLLQNLPVEAVYEWIGSLLNMDDLDLLVPLGDLAHSRTMGNPYHLQQFVQTLERNKLMTYDPGKERWAWDLESIQSETSVSDNVAALVLSKIARLHVFVQGVLKLGSSLGFQFDVAILKLVALGSLPPENRAKMEAMYSSRIDQVIACGMKEGFLETSRTSAGNIEHKFTHDRIQQALYGMFTAKELLKLHLRIGKLLKAYLQENETSDKGLIFLTVEQLNRGLVLASLEERVDIAKLNLNASRIAMSKSAFEAATDYIGISAGLLQEHWEIDYELTLDVFTTAAQFNCCSGRFEESEAFSDAVLKNSKNTTDRMQVYYTMIDALASQDMLSEALDLGSRILNDELEVKTPRMAHSTQSVAEFGRVVLLLRGQSDEDLLDAKPVEDEKMQAGMRLTLALSMIAFFSQENMNYPFLWMRAMKLTLQYGQDRVTAPIFACFGATNSILGRCLAAHRFGLLARKLTAKTGAFQDESITEVLINSFTSHWQKPLTHQIEYYDRAHRAGLATGNTNFAVLADVSKIETNFATGFNLDDLEKECARACNLLIALNKRTLMKACLPIWQCVLNLQGKSEDALVLTGEAMDEDEVIDHECQSGFDLAMSNAHHLKMTLACLFQSWEDCADAATIMNSHPEIYLGISAHYFCISFTVFSGIAYFNLARMSWRRRYLIAARMSLKRAAKWVRIGCPDAIPIYAMLLAEQTAFTKNVKKIQAQYDDAITKCKEAKQLHYLAFANERCGTVLREMNEVALAESYFREAIICYTQWGATAKVYQIKQTLILPLAIEGVTSVSKETVASKSSLGKDTQLSSYPSTNESSDHTDPAEQE